jgi:hypothetical protein
MVEDDEPADRTVVNGRDEQFAAFVEAAGPYLLHTAELLCGDLARAPAEEVASLQTHVLPVLEEVQPTWYEQESCEVLEYPRGTFSDDGKCAGRPAEQAFDDLARADLDRLLDAVERSGVPTDELQNATYAADGSIESARFLRSGGGIKWTFAYLYSPHERPSEWDSPLGPVTITPIRDTGWWFEKSPDD